MTDEKSKSSQLPLSHPLYEEKKKRTDTERDNVERAPHRSFFPAVAICCNKKPNDIATAVSMLGKFQSDSLMKHWKTLKHVVRYLIGTLDYEIFRPIGTGMKLKAFIDAD